MDSKRRVVITGLGVLAPGAIGVEPFWELLSRGQSGISEINLYDVQDFRLKAAGEIKNFEPKKLVENRKALKVMARDIQIAVAAAKLVMEDAGLIDNKPDPTRFGVSLGAGYINTSLQELSFAIRDSINEQGNFDIKKYGLDGIQALTPLWLLKYLPNMLACHISIFYDAQGPSNSLTAGCAASSQAIGEAYHIIQRGAADLMIAGGAESKIDPLSQARFEMLGLLTKNGVEPQKSVRPFDRNRDGFVMGEAAGLVILEELEQAKKRGAKIYGELLGFGSSSNLSPLIGKVNTRAYELTMKLALERAQVDKEQIDYIHAHGLGTKDSDKLETEAIKNLFGQRAYKIPVSSIKGATGYIGAASGAIGTVTSILAIQNQLLPPTLNYQEKDPECDLDYVPNQARESKCEIALINTFGLNGQNASLVVRSYDGS